MWSTGKALLEQFIQTHNTTHCSIGTIKYHTHLIDLFSHKHLQMMNSFLTLDPIGCLMQHVSTEMLVKLNMVTNTLYSQRYMCHGKMGHQQIVHNIFVCCQNY